MKETKSQSIDIEPTDWQTLGRIECQLANLLTVNTDFPHTAQ